MTHDSGAVAEHFRTMFEDAPVGYQSLDADGVIQEVNGTWLELLGYARNEVIGRSFGQFLVPESQGLFPQRFANFKAAGRVRGVVFDMIRKDGAVITVSFDGNVHHDSEGRFVRTHCVFQDITERRGMQQELERRNAFIQEILDHLPIGLAVNTIDDGKRQYINQAFYDAYGWDETVITSVDAYFSHVFGEGEYRRQMEQQMRADLASGDPSRMRWESLKVTTQDGRQKAVTAINIPLPEQNLMISTAQDVTQREAALEALKRSEEQYRQLVESANSIILKMDKDGRITFLNEFALAFFGYSPEEVIGQSAMIIVPPSDSGGTDQQGLLQRIIADASSFSSYENDNITKDGRRVRVAWTNRAIRNGDELVGLLSVGNDVTRQREIEQQLLQSQRMEAVGLLAGGVAHDFRNQLTVIAGYCDLLMRRADFDEETRQFLSEINQAADRSERVARQLLAFSRTQQLSPEPLDVNETVERLLRNLSPLLGEDIRVVFAPSNDIAWIDVDAGQLQQALVNLMVNAKDAMPSGGLLTVEITAGPVEKASRPDAELPDAPHVRIRLTDTGHGMDAHTLSRIFEPFFTTKAPGRGTGLGLASVYGFAKQSHGFIRVSSEVGRGSRFDLYFPLVAAAEPATTRVPAVVQAPAPPSAATILLVEDEMAIRHMAARILRQEGYRVLEASGAKEAATLGAHYDSPIDLMVTDIVMPELQGPELATHLTALRPNLRVLYISGYPGDALDSRGYQHLKQMLLPKPFQASELLNRVREALA